MRSLRSSLMAALLVLASSGLGLAEGGPAAPVADDAGALASLRVPGGTAALARAAGLDDGAPRGGVLLDVVRVLYESPAGADVARDARVDALREYLAAVAGVERARTALPPAGLINLRLAAHRDSHRAVEDAVRAIGARLDENRGEYRLSLPEDERARDLRRAVRNAGLDPDAVVRAFNGGETASLALPEDDVPLPLGQAWWVRIVSPASGMEGCLLTSLLSDRRAALMYHGLLSVDGPTRAFLGSRGEVLDRLLSGSRPDVFATLGRSIRVRDGQADVPGGPRAVALWEGLLGRRVSEPAAFIFELVERDGGRLALLYDAIDHLDAAHQAFVFGLANPDAGARVERFRATYRAFSVSLRALDLTARPFRRVPGDGVHLLSMTRVLPSGLVPGPDSQRFWGMALSGDDLPSDPARDVRAEDGDAAVDVTWLLERVCVEDHGGRQQLLSRWLFGQRVFAGTPTGKLPDALVALRGFGRFPTLLMALERIGVTDPGIYASAVLAARRVGEIGDRTKAELALRQFQGAVALIDRVRFGRSLTAEAASRLVATLAAIPLSKDDEYLASVGTWIEEQFLPAIGTPAAMPPSPAGVAGPLEARVLAAMSGVQTPLPPALVEWEGLQYRVDVGAAEFDRLARVRRKQGGASLDAVLAFSREASRLRGVLPGIDAIPARIAALTEAAGALADGAGASGPAPASDAVRVRDLLNGAVRELRKIRKPKDLAKAERISIPLRRASDRYLGDVVVSLVYAPHLGDPDGPALLAGDPAVRHDFGAYYRIAEHRAAAPWRIAEETLGGAGGWRATGSVLGLDVALAPLSLRRLATDSLPPPPAVNDIDRSSLASTLVLANPFDVTDAGRDALADAIRRGRARVEGLAANPSRHSHASGAAGLGEWRRQILPWALRREPERVADYFSMADLARLGSSETTPFASLDTWGTSALAREGCLCLRYPESGSWETLAGRFGTALVAEQVPDLMLRVAEALSRFRLPARLLPAVLALATQDVLDTCAPAYIDDWNALVTAVRRLPDARFADDIAALTSGGPLVPADRESPHDTPR